MDNFKNTTDAQQTKMVDNLKNAKQIYFKQMQRFGSVRLLQTNKNLVNNRLSLALVSLKMEDGISVLQHVGYTFLICIYN